jgi:hypothetical protein
MSDAALESAFSFFESHPRGKPYGKLSGARTENRNNIGFFCLFLCPKLNENAT